ncbi:MAG: hypothetical protein ACRDLF_11215, partial [Solirubrobacteraceae bacterium]
MFLKEREPLPIDEGMSVQGRDRPSEVEQVASGSASARAESADASRHELRRLGEALKGGTDEVVAGMLRRSAGSGAVLDALVE